MFLCRSIFFASFVAGVYAFVAPRMPMDPLQASPARSRWSSTISKSRSTFTTIARNIATTSSADTSATAELVDEISADNPLKVLIAGGGVGGLSLAKTLSKNPNMEVVVLERTDEFKRFGGPIQLASNALQVLKEMDEDVFEQIMEKFTFTGDKTNGSM
jgi:hypothetical protein